MKKFLSALIILMLFTAAAYATEKKPVRIARLPIIFKDTVPDYDTRAELEMKIARAVHIPMNNTLQIAEYLPTKDSTQALNDIWHKMRSENKKARIQDAMKPLAKKLNADIIICPILLHYSQYVDNMTSFDETYLHSQVRAKLIVYDRRTDNLIDKKNSQIYHDIMSTTGTADYLTKICFDKLIDDTKIRQLMRELN
ncbi:MAG: hypothetical protein IKZ53_06555 [Selenomonadaceae bacterium]|nr:hypothetical protein [Selenomonadaceae bacterium]